MDLSLASLGLALLAGLASILSPCVLPVVPIIVTGTERDSAWRPVAIVLGLALTFMAMGAATSLAGAAIASKMLYIEKAAGALILLFGLLMFLDVNLFKKMAIFQRIQSSGPGGGGMAPVDLVVELRDGAAPASTPARRAEDGGQDEEQGHPEVPRAELSSLREVATMSR